MKHSLVSLVREGTFRDEKIAVVVVQGDVTADKVWHHLVSYFLKVDECIDLQKLMSTKFAASGNYYYSLVIEEVFYEF
jgi:hypothetical protein